MHADFRLNRRLGGTLLVMAAVIMAACDATLQNGHSPSDPSTSSSTHSLAADAGSPEPCTEDPHLQQSATAATWSDVGTPLTGPHAVAVEQEPDLPRHTVYRPSKLPDANLPIVSWGNGGCGADGLASAEFLAEIASHGYLVISNGVPNGSGEENRDGSTHITALDWAADANANSCSRYFKRLATDNIAVMGYSCGGLMSLNAAGDPRISTVVAMNSGLLAPDQGVYASLHTPIAYINGGEKDIAYENGLRDYRSISHVPVYHANLPVGHGGTYEQDNGGEYARAGVAWLNWHLKGDQGVTGRKMFLGKSCGICKGNWVVEHKNF